MGQNNGKPVVFTDQGEYNHGHINPPRPMREPQTPSPTRTGSTQPNKAGSPASGTSTESISTAASLTPAEQPTPVRSL